MRARQLRPTAQKVWGTTGARRVTRASGSRRPVPAQASKGEPSTATTWSPSTMPNAARPSAPNRHHLTGDPTPGAGRAANGGNRQIARFLVVTDRARIREFGALYREAWWAKRRDEGHAWKGIDDIPPEEKTHRAAAGLPGEAE